MFPEFRELITELKQNDAHFSKKKEKLHLKDELYRILRAKS